MALCLLLLLLLLIVATHTCAVIIAQQGALELTARSLHLARHSK